MDEIPVYMNMIPFNAVVVRGKETIKVRTTTSDKCRLTAASCIAIGNMLPPMLIFKGTTPRSINGVKSSGGTVVSYQKRDGY